MIRIYLGYLFKYFRKLHYQETNEYYWGREQFMKDFCDKDIGNYWYWINKYIDTANF